MRIIRFNFGRLLRLPGPAEALLRNADQHLVVAEEKLHRDSLAFHTGNDRITWRWDEVAVIVSNSSMHDREHCVWTAHEYTLNKISGEMMILDDGVKGIEDAIQPIKQSVFGRLLPPGSGALAADLP